VAQVWVREMALHWPPAVVAAVAAVVAVAVPMPLHIPLPSS